MPRTINHCANSLPLPLKQNLGCMAFSRDTCTQKQNDKSKPRSQMKISIYIQKIAFCLNNVHLMHAASQQGLPTLYHTLYSIVSTLSNKLSVFLVNIVKV